MRALAFVVLASLPMMLTASEVPPAVGAAVARQTWTWFGSTEAAARAKATAAGTTLTVVWRDGKQANEQGSGVCVAILAGVVIEARDQASLEGCREAALIPLLGMSEAAATAEAQRLRRPVRVVWRDGTGLPVTMDYAEARLNLHVTRGIVVGISGG